jgi:hypothetical protein
MRVIGGGPLQARVAASTPARRRPRRESDRVVGALSPGNAGGAKGPDFWCAFEDGKVEVIGDEPTNTIKDRRCPRLLCRGAKEITVPNPRAIGLLPVCLTLKPVGKPDAGNPHVRFDEREGKRGVAARPKLDSIRLLDNCDLPPGFRTIDYVRG